MQRDVAWFRDSVATGCAGSADSRGGRSDVRSAVGQAAESGARAANSSNDADEGDRVALLPDLRHLPGLNRLPLRIGVLFRGAINQRWDGPNLASFVGVGESAVRRQ
jgi:hypothetical protein